MWECENLSHVFMLFSLKQVIDLITSWQVDRQDKQKKRQKQNKVTFQSWTLLDLVRLYVAVNRD